MINTCFSCSLIRKVLFKILVSFIPVTMILLLCFFVTSAEADPFPTEQKIVLEDKGKILIVHGSDCGTSEKLAKLDSVNLSGVLILPQYATDATVFLNGWYAGYTKDDEEIAQIHSEISSIKLSAGKLQWKAVGELADEESDEPYQWCYTYTAIAWNGNEIDAVPDHSDGSINRKSGKCSGNLNFIETN